MNIDANPLATECYYLCRAIENIPASEEATRATELASKFLRKLCDNETVSKLGVENGD